MRFPSVFNRPLQSLGLALLLPASLTMTSTSVAQAPPVPPSQPLTLKADVTEANAKTGVVVARGNVQINYPSRQIQATAAQATFYNRERRIILSGNVYVLQQGNSLRGETITYLVDEGRFVALPQSGKQVEAIYLVQDAPQPPTPAAAPPFTQPEFRPAGQPNQR